MEYIHFKILEFLNRQTEPVCEDRFPNIITAFYPHNTASEGGLIHDLQIVLSATKKWITTTAYSPNYYIITDFGKSALKRETDEISEKGKKEKLEKRKSEIDLVNAERTLKTYPSTRLMAIIACVVSVCLLLLKLAEALSIWP